MRQSYLICYVYLSCSPPLCHTVSSGGCIPQEHHDVPWFLLSTLTSTVYYRPKRKRCPFVGPHVQNLIGRITQAGMCTDRAGWNVILGLSAQKHGSPLCTIKSMNGPNPHFVHNIYMNVYKYMSYTCIYICVLMFILKPYT